MSTDAMEMKKKLEHFGIDYYKRQTGRTTRMMQEAMAVAKSGKAVTVLMKDLHSVDSWLSRGWGVPGMEIINMHANENRVDWKNLKMLDHRANNVLFIDHDVFYGEFRHILGAFTKYDLPVTGVPQHVMEQVVDKAA